MIEASAHERRRADEQRTTPFYVIRRWHHVVHACARRRVAYKKWPDSPIVKRAAMNASVGVDPVIRLAGHTGREKSQQGPNGVIAASLYRKFAMVLRGRERCGHEM
ncbi:hypothetical protein IHE31_05345 [Mycetohabitans rhizoxinica]